MEYEKHYELRYGWCYIGSDYCYNEYEVFLTEKEINQYIFDLLHNDKIKVIWYKKFV